MNYIRPQDEDIRLNRWYDDLCRRIHDPNYNLIKNNYRIVEEVRDFLIDQERFTNRKPTDYDPMVVDMLLRVRNTSAAVFAITVGQFPEYWDVEEDIWLKYGYRDILGFTWLAPAS